MSFLKGKKKPEAPVPAKPESFTSAPEIQAAPTAPAHIPLVTKKPVVPPAPKTYDAKVVVNTGRIGNPMRVEVQSFPEGFDHGPQHVLAKVTNAFNVNGCQFVLGEVVLLNREQFHSWHAFVDVVK